jgi:hypothetical protein
MEFLGASPHYSFSLPFPISRLMHQKNSAQVPPLPPRAPTPCHDDANALIYVATSPPPGPYAVMVMAHGHRSSICTHQSQWSTSPSRSTPTHTPHLPCSCSAALPSYLTLPRLHSAPRRAAPTSALRAPLQRKSVLETTINTFTESQSRYT